MKRLFVVLLCFWGLAGVADAKPVSEDQFSARFVTMLKSALPDVSIEVTGPMDLIVKPGEGRRIPSLPRQCVPTVPERSRAA